MSASHLGQVRKLMHKERAEAFVIFNNESSGQPATQYLSGFSGSSSVLIITRQKCFLLTDGRYFEQVRLEASGVTLIRIGEHKVGDILVGLVKTERLKSVLIDGTVTSASELALLQKRMRGLRIIQQGGFLQAIRTQKSKEEVTPR